MAIHSQRMWIFFSINTWYTFQSVPTMFLPFSKQLGAEMSIAENLEIIVANVIEITHLDPPSIK